MTTGKSKAGATRRKPTDAKATDEVPDPNSLQLIAREGVSDGYLKAETVFHSLPRHAATGGMFAAKLFGKSNETTINDGVAVLREACVATRAGDLSLHRDMLTAQAITLDGIFTELARRAALNMGEYLEASDRFLRLALKAQSQSRATVEALDRLVRGGEQVVRHIHVDNRGGQAVIAETVNTGGQENDESVKQSDATAKIGASTALPCPDPFRNGMPISCGERQAALQNARRDESGCAKG